MVLFRFLTTKKSWSHLPLGKLNRTMGVNVGVLPIHSQREEIWLTYGHCDPAGGN